MSKYPYNSRRSFLKKFAALSALTASSLPAIVVDQQQKAILKRTVRTLSPNDRLQIATIGMGIIGFIDTVTAISVPGIELVAACDLYDGRLVHTKEVFGDQVTTTRDYKEIIDRSDVDAILICTPDHWHARIAIDALKAGKHVYCEKPMVQDVVDGKKLIRAQKNSGCVFQVGSQFVSSVIFEEARKQFASGAIGELNMIEARYNRNSAIGAWQYTIPPDASPKTVDWEQFISGTKKRAFDPVRFFRWRNYWDYGTGVAGDLFVHLFSGLHHILSSNGPNRIVATGGLRFWKDGRDAPDMMLGLCDYPETESHPAFNLTLQTNFAHGGGGGTDMRLIGSEGVMDLGFRGLTITTTPRYAPSKKQVIEGYNSVRTFSKSVQQEIADNYEQYYTDKQSTSAKKSTLEFNPPENYDERFDHFIHFFNAIRTNGSVAEDAAYGFRAAAPAVLTNTSYLKKKPMRWDPEKMVLRP
jgi:predicted dehydrogenase